MISGSCFWVVLLVQSQLWMVNWKKTRLEIISSSTSRKDRWIRTQPHWRSVQNALSILEMRSEHPGDLGDVFRTTRDPRGISRPLEQSVPNPRPAHRCAWKVWTSAANHDQAEIGNPQFWLAKFSSWFFTGRLCHPDMFLYKNLTTLPFLCTYCIYLQSFQKFRESNANFHLKSCYLRKDLTYSTFIRVCVTICLTLTL
jgi:hypothetical protein